MFNVNDSVFPPFLDDLGVETNNSKDVPHPVCRRRRIITAFRKQIKSRRQECLLKDPIIESGLIDTLQTLSTSGKYSRMTSLQSYVHGVHKAPLLGETIGTLLDRIATRYPNRPALVVRHQSVHWSYARFREEVEMTAAGLLSLGLKPGDRIGIWSPNKAEWVVTQFATAKAGLILVNINPAYRLHELKLGPLPTGDAAQH